MIHGLSQQANKRTNHEGYSEEALFDKPDANDQNDDLKGSMSIANQLGQLG